MEIQLFWWAMMDLRVDPWLLCRFFAWNSCSWEVSENLTFMIHAKRGGWQWLIDVFVSKSLRHLWWRYSHASLNRTEHYHVPCSHRSREAFESWWPKTKTTFHNDDIGEDALKNTKTNTIFVILHSCFQSFPGQIVGEVGKNRFLNLKKGWRPWILVVSYAIASTR